MPASNSSAHVTVDVTVDRASRNDDLATAAGSTSSIPSFVCEVCSVTGQRDAFAFCCQHPNFRACDAMLCSNECRQALRLQGDPIGRRRRHHHLWVDTSSALAAEDGANGHAADNGTLANHGLTPQPLSVRAVIMLDLSWTLVAVPANEAELQWWSDMYPPTKVLPPPCPNESPISLWLRPHAERLLKALLQLQREGWCQVGFYTDWPSSWAEATVCWLLQVAESESVSADVGKTWAWSKLGGDERSHSRPWIKKEGCFEYVHFFDDNYCERDYQQPARDTDGFDDSEPYHPLHTKSLEKILREITESDWKMTEGPANTGDISTLVYITAVRNWRDTATENLIDGGEKTLLVTGWSPWSRSREEEKDQELAFLAEFLDILLRDKTQHSELWAETVACVWAVKRFSPTELLPDLLANVAAYL
mmetsp:Transcript_62176/g.148325  ORF Transcript_62176/g.148325 Transcript_62176/m.148325 type:complete len:421 (-) Transcript_62176:184-1446(-)